MTNAQIQAHIDNSLRDQHEKRAAYFDMTMKYMQNLGYGTATKEQRLKLVALKEDYYKS